ncbi:MAG TPA: type II secretion system protein [Gemmatimonadaceae bacterium]|nr:type II secretion system protein [Gemmatimonadaceae bacterium]
MSAKSALVEVVSVLAIVGSIGAIAVPKAATLQDERTADALNADIEVVRSAVYAFYSDSAYFPPEGVQGDILVTLEPYLPAKFTFRRPYGVMEYRNWPARAPFTRPVAAQPGDTIRPDSTIADRVRDSLADTIAGVLVPPAATRVRPIPGAPADSVPTDSAVVSRIIGISVVPRDARVAAIAAHRARRMARFLVGDKVTFIIFGA